MEFGRAWRHCRDRLRGGPGGAYFDSLPLRLLYLGGPIAALIFLFGVRIWLIRWLPTITLSMAAAAAALLAAEAALLAQVDDVWGNVDFVNPRADEISRLRALGQNAQINLFAKGLSVRDDNENYRSRIMIGGEEIMPLTGISNATVLMCRDGEEHWKSFESDAQGFSNPPEVWAANPATIGAVGDSHVQGWCVPPEQSFMGLVRGAVPATINLGGAGNGPLSDLGAIREYLAPLRPGTVLWFFTGANDVGDLNRERRTPLLAAYLDPAYSQGLRQRQSEIDEALIAFSAEGLATAMEGGRTVDYREVARRVATLYDIRKLIGVDRGAVTPPDWPLLGRVLAAARDEVRGWGGDLLFVYLPSRRVVYLPSRRDVLSGDNPNRQEILRTAADQGLTVIDLTPLFVAKPDPPALFQARTGTHYSLSGHELVAAGILQGIDR